MTAEEELARVIAAVNPFFLELYSIVAASQSRSGFASICKDMSGSRLAGSYFAATWSTDGEISYPTQQSFNCDVVMAEYMAMCARLGSEQ